MFRKNDNDWVKKCVTLEAEGARQRGRSRRTWKEVVDKDMDDLHIKPSDAVDHTKWRRMIRGNWSERISDSDAEIGIGILHFWRWLT